MDCPERFATGTGTVESARLTGRGIGSKMGRSSNRAPSVWSIGSSRTEQNGTERAETFSHQPGPRCRCSPRNPHWPSESNG